jgi:hypothetical protein
VVFSSDGTVRYVAAKPLEGSHLRYPTHQEVAENRRRAFVEYVDRLDAADPALSWGDRAYRDTRMARRSNFAAAHRARRSWSAADE